MTRIWFCSDGNEVLCCLHRTQLIEIECHNLLQNWSDYPPNPAQACSEGHRSVHITLFGGSFDWCSGPDVQAQKHELR